nr:GGDEF domain-containing protein [Motilibacter aurantiacus]
MGAGFAAGLAAAGLPSAAQTWAFASASIGAVAVTINSLASRLRVLADRDPLTGLLTRSAFAEAADRALRLGERTGRPVSLALLDLDAFKAVNDRDGHQAGDHLLRTLTRAWQGALRRSDVLGRYGGDEFVLLMPDTDRVAAAGVLHRLRQATPDGSWTSGTAQWQEGESFDSWLSRTDADLYVHKRARQSA